MKKNYIIHWKSKLTGTTGSGKTKFTFSDAERQCCRLDREFPDITHSPLPIFSREPSPQNARP